MKVRGLFLFLCVCVCVCVCEIDCALRKEILQFRIKWKELKYLRFVLPVLWTWKPEMR